MSEFRILAVCTANICRSPAFEVMLRDGTRTHPGLDGDGVFLASVGLRGREGEPPDPAMVAMLAKFGIELAGGSSRGADEAKFDEADLILVATRRHRSTIVRGDVTLRDRTFTFREFARYCAAAPAPVGKIDTVTRLADLARFAVEHRGTLHPRRAADDDVADPYGRNRFAYRKATIQLKDAAEAILDAAHQSV